jgi:hypothetical protein
MTIWSFTFGHFDNFSRFGVLNQNNLAALRNQQEEKKLLQVPWRSAFSTLIGWNTSRKFYCLHVAFQSSLFR